MGVKPKTSQHKQGPGQNEITFKSGDVLEAADNLLTFKSAVKAIAARNGLFASFMPKPILNKSGSGLHINLSLSQNGHNIFKNPSEFSLSKNCANKLPMLGGFSGEHSKVAESFIAGILEKTPEMTMFLNPSANSYERFGKDEAPQYVSWSHQNRSQLIRIPAAMGEKVRMELRSPDPSVNPYLAFALILSAGLDGIENELSLADAVDVDLYEADERITNQLVSLPDSLNKAIELAHGSSFIKNTLGEEMLSKYLYIKKEEAAEFSEACDKYNFCRERYFTFL